MLGNDIANMSIQIVSVDALQKRTSRTIGSDKLNAAALRTPTANTATQLDSLVRKLYALSTNTYQSTTVIGKSDLTEVIAE